MVPGLLVRLGALIWFGWALCGIYPQFLIFNNRNANTLLNIAVLSHVLQKTSRGKRSQQDHFRNPSLNS